MIAYHPTFDTLKFVQKLKAAGMPELQAVALTEAHNEALMESTDHMIATKADVSGLKQALKHDMSELQQEFKHDISELQQEFKHDISELKQEFKHDMSELKQEFKHDISELKQEFKHDIAELKHDIQETKHDVADLHSRLKLHDWMLGFLLTGMGTLILKAFFI